MKVIEVKNVTRNTGLGNRIRTAVSILERAVGLLSTSHLSPGEGLYLSPCRSIHTFFMRYAIDVLFLDAQGIVLSQHTFRPWRLSGIHWRAAGVLELPEGTVSRSGTHVGDQISMKEMN